MYVAVVPNRGSPPAILLRESYREAGKTKNRTLANLSRWPAERIEQLRAVLRGDKLLPAAEAVEIVRALPHGHVLAALGTARRIALDAVLPRRAPQRRRDLGAGPDHRPPARAGGQAGDRADAGSRHRQPFAGRDAGARPRHRQGGLCRARLPGPRAAVHRGPAGPSPPQEWRAAALRRYLHLPRRTLLRTGPAWLQPRPPGRPAADCHWPDVRRRRLPGRRRGVRGQYRRSADLVVADREAEAALQAAARGDGGRPRRADQRAPRADIAPGWPRLDHCTAGAGDQAAGRRRRAVAALAVRRPRDGGDHQPR